MGYGRHPYGGVAYAGSDVAEIPQDQIDPILAVEVAFTTAALEEPVWEPVSTDVRAWDVQRGRNRELERFQPGRATVVLGNLDRQYDSVNADGPHFDNLKPMRRIRIRETFNGVTYPTFDGFIDRWQLNYPDIGKDATATVTATDAFKIFARTDLPRSVYVDEVTADAPAFWWRLDEGLEEGAVNQVALNNGTVGGAGNGSYVGAVYPGSDRLVVNDPGTSLRQENSDVTPGVPVSGVDIPSAQVNFLSRLQAGDATTVEFWARPREETTFSTALYQEASTPSTSGFQLYWFAGGTNSGRFASTIHTDTVQTPEDSAPPGSINHVVYRFTPSGADMLEEIFLNGVLSVSGTLNDTLNTGTIIVSAIGHTLNTAANWTGQISQVAVYLSALSDTRIAAHYAAGTAPWQGDLPGGRLGRVLDEAGWLSAAREIDGGAETLQSAEITGQTVLEHAQKVSETEYGLLFIDRAGNVRFVDQAGMAARTVGPDVYGDETGEIGYRDMVPDDGDQTIRNRATISRLNGVAKTNVSPQSVIDYGRFDYVLDGLLHDSDDWSQDYADAIVLAYQLPLRRVVQLSLGPPIVGEEDQVYPGMLGHELGDYITVRHRPPGGGALFTQACVIEGIRHADTPKMRTTTWTLSPAPEGVAPVPLELLQAEDGDTLETETGDELETE